MRIAVGLEYDGTAFCGWQSQAHGRGVQSCVEEALSRVADHPIEVTAAGRTDAGVHAAMQVVHFDTTATRSARSWVLGANTNLPPQMSALWAREVSEAFHARYSALARRYCYFILSRASRAAIAADRVCWIRDELDPHRMQAAAAALIGEHDFSSFRAAQCQSHTSVRKMHRIEVSRSGPMVVIDVTANAFLHHMVRNIAGVLMAIGRGDRPVEWCGEVLAACDRTQGGITAPASGLYLMGVRYASVWELPSEGQWFMPFVA